jgi:autotransporter-associated beta strand protein/ELWxxDGT repeat protein
MADVDFVRLGFTRLEDRVVLDGAAPVADLNPGAASSSPAEQVEFNGSVYFSAEGTDGNGNSVGRELYRLDPDGSVTLVSDINAGAAGSDPSQFEVFDDELYFAATGAQGRELYKVDDDGNVSLVANIGTGAASSNPEFLSEQGSKLYFAATGPQGRELYSVNQGGNVSLVANINPGTASSNPSDLFEYEGDLYFVATGPQGRTLYVQRSSGNSNPTPINLGAGVTNPQGFIEFDGAVYFSAVHPTEGRELYKLTTKNNQSTVTRVANLDGTSNSSDPSGFTVFDNHLYFAATTANGRELFQLDSADNIRQIDIAPGAASSSPSGFTEFDGQLYFAATVGGQRGLYRLDTSGASPTAVNVPLPTGVSLPEDARFYALGNELYFAADGPQDRELYVMNLAGFVTLAADINAGTGSSDPADVRLLGGRIYVVATEPSVGRELFVLTPTQSAVSTLDVVDGTLVFTDESGDKDNRLVVSSDGTNLLIRDENGHDITLLTPLAGASGSGTSEVSIPLASLAGVSTLAINTRGGNDSVTFDLSANADELLGQFETSTYDGGDNAPDRPGDRLRFIGDGETNSTYTPDANDTGSGVVIVSSSTQTTTTFDFDHLEPVEFTAMASATLIAPDTATDADVLTVSEGVDSLDGLADVLIVSGTVGGTAIESAYFFGNDSVVIVTGSGSGSDGTDEVTVLGADNNHNNANLTIDTGPAGADHVLISGDVELAGALTIHTFLLDVQAIVMLGGNAWLTARDDITFSAAGSLLALPAASINVTLRADSDNTGGGGIALADGSLIDAGAGQIVLTATDDITLGRLQTTHGGPAAVTITSFAGAVLDGDASIDIVASSLVLTAQSAGTAASPLQTQIELLTANIQDGDLHLVEADGLTIENVAALAAGGDVSITTLTGDLLVRQIEADGLVSLNAVQGSIQRTGTLPVNIAATDLELLAASGIGTASAPLLTDVDRLEAAGGTGGVFIQNAGDVQIGGISPSRLNLTGLSASGSDIVVATTGSLTAVEAIHTTGAGAIDLAAGQNMSIDTTIAADSSPIDLTAGRALTLLPGASVATVSGAITVSANQGAAATPGTFTGILLDNATISSQSGPITLSGRSGDSGANLAGVELRGGSSIETVDGAISVAGVSLGTGTGSDGVRLVDGSHIASSGAGNVTVTGSAGNSGHGVLMLNDSSIGSAATATGDVLLAGTGGGNLADIAWDSLTITKMGGTYTFQDTVEGGRLVVLPGNYRVVFLDGGIITEAVDFLNTGGVVLGDEDSDLLTFTGGLTSTAGPTTIQGTVATRGTEFTLGPTTLVSSVTLQTDGGNVTLGPVSGAGVPLTILADSGDVSLADPANVIGDLVITADDLTLVENQDITQAGAWTTTGETALDAGTHDIVLDQPGNALGTLQLTGANITVIEAADMLLAAATFSGRLNLQTAGNLLVDGLATGSGSADLAASGDITFSAAGRLVAQPAASIDVTMLADADEAGGGGIDLAEGSLIDAGAGTIALKATDDITLSRLITTSGSPAAVTITSLAGAVLDGDDTGDADVIAESAGAVVTIAALAGVGTPANALDLQVRRLVVTTTNSDQHLSELDELESIDLDAGQGQIALSAGGSVEDDDASTDVIATNLTLTVLSAGALASPLQTQIGVLTATLADGDLHLVEADGLTVQDVSALAAGGDVAIASLAGDVLVQRVAAAGLVSLEAQQGAIERTGAQPVTITAADLELAAGSGVGSSNSPLLTDVDRLEAAGGTGGIFIQNIDDPIKPNSNELRIGGIGTSILNLNGLSATDSDIAVASSGPLTAIEGVRTTDAGSIDLRGVGDVTLEAPVSSADGDIDLSATRDVLTSAGGNISTQAGTIRLTADSDNAGGGTIGVAGNIDLGGGQAIFSLPDATGEVSGIISGSGGIVKEGPGTLSLAPTSVNTYTGTTDVLGGTLRVDGDIGAAGPAERVTIAGGATLTGSGNVNAPVFASDTTAQILPTGNLRLGDGSRSGFDFAGTMIVRPGDTVTLRDADFAELGLLTQVDSVGRLVANNGVEIGAGESLAGGGEVAGSIRVLVGGQLSPGASPGVLTTNPGDLTLQPGAVYTTEVLGEQPGTEYDQMNVGGAVSVNGAVLDLEGGNFKPQSGTVFTIISNDGSDSVQGTFRDPQGNQLKEGAIVRFGDVTARISYVGGPGGNDVVLDTRFVRAAEAALVGGALLPRENERLSAPRLQPRLIQAGDSAQAARQADAFDSQTAALEVRTAQRLRVFFRLVNEGTGQEEPKEFELDPGVLRDLLAIFKRFRFQDGRYRIYLQEPGKRERLILDVNVVEGKVVPPNFRDAELLPESGAAPADAPKPPAGGEQQPQGKPTEPQTPAADVGVSSGRATAPQALTTITLGAAAAVAGLPEWSARVRALLASGDFPATKFSRLLRRIRPH